MLQQSLEAIISAPTLFKNSITILQKGDLKEEEKEEQLIQAKINEYIKAKQSQLEQLNLQIVEFQRFYIYERTSKYTHTIFENGKFEHLIPHIEKDMKSVFDDLFLKFPNLKETPKVTSFRYSAMAFPMSDFEKFEILFKLILNLKTAFPKNEVPLMEIEIGTGPGNLRKIKDILADPKNKPLFNQMLAKAIKELPQANAIEILTNLYELQKYQKEQYEREEIKKEKGEQYKNSENEFILAIKAETPLDKIIHLKEKWHFIVDNGRNAGAEDPRRIYFKLAGNNDEECKNCIDELKSELQPYLDKDMDGKEFMLPLGVRAPPIG